MNDEQTDAAVKRRAGRCGGGRADSVWNRAERDEAREGRAREGLY